MCSPFYLLSLKTCLLYTSYLLKQYIENYTADITRDKQLRLIIMRKESRQVIGAIDCFDYDTTNRKAAIGLLIDPGHKRQGFGRDALETFVEYAFRFLHLHQLYVHIPVCNTASIALFRTCGFHESTRLKDWIRLPQGLSLIHISFTAGKMIRLCGYTEVPYRPSHVIC